VKVKNTGKLNEHAGLVILAMAIAIPGWRSSGFSSGFCSLPLLSASLAPLASAAALPAQVRNRDPLTENEADQLRESADEPDKRLGLLVDFATARMTKVDEARTTRPAATQAQRIHDALDEFGRVMDEVDDNIDDYESRKMDMRKGLARVIEADAVFQTKLAELKAAPNGNSDAMGASDVYQFVLEDDIDIVNSQFQRAKETLQEQERRIQEEKEQKKKQGYQR
jgi:septal ring factor EnvC (AmiA/AmiB activator)